MPTTVDVPGRGLVEFPDEMSQDQIKATIKRKFYVEPAIKASTELTDSIYKSLISPAAGEASEMGRQEGEAIRGFAATEPAQMTQRVLGTLAAGAEGSAMGREQSQKERDAFEAKMALPRAPKVAGVFPSTVGWGEPRPAKPGEESLRPLSFHEHIDQLLPSTELPYEVQRQAVGEAPPDTALQAIQMGSRNALAPFLKPEQIALIAATGGLGSLGQVGATLNRVIMGYFGATAAKSAAQQLPEIFAANKTPAQRLQSGIETLVSLGISVGATRGAIKPAEAALLQKAKEVEPVIPLTAKALENQVTGEVLKMPEGAKPETATKPVERTPDAIQEQSANAEVLRHERPEVGLQEVGARDKGVEVAPAAQEPQAPAQQAQALTKPPSPTTVSSHEPARITAERPELQAPEDFAKSEIQKLATNDLGNISERSPTSFAFDLSRWTSNAKAEAQGISGVFAYVPEGTDTFLVEFPAGTRPADAIQSLVQAIKQGDGPGPSWLPLAQLDEIKRALRQGDPVNADAVEQHGIRVPRGYVKEGGIYRRMDRTQAGVQPTPEPKGTAGIAAANRPAVKLMPQESGQQQIIPAERKVDGTWETHNEIIERAKLSTEDIDRRIFVDEQGKEKSREQTAQDLAKQGVPTEIPGQAHSTDVNAAIEAKQEVAPATPEPTVEAKGGAFESWFQKAQEKFPSAGVADWKADWLKENRMARWTYKKNPEAVRKIKGLPASYEYTGEVQFAGERIPFNFFSDVRGVKKSSAQAAWHAIERRYYERTKGTTEGLRERVGEQPTEPVPPAATGGVGVGEREPARAEPQPVEPPPPAPVSGAGTPEPAVAAQKVEAEVRPADLLNKSQLIEQLIGKKPEARVESVESRLRWEKDRKAYAKFTVAELRDKLTTQQAENAAWKQRQDAAKELYPAIQKIADDAGPSWRTALKAKADAEGVRFAPPTTATKGDAAYTLASALAEKQLNQPPPAPSEKGAPEVAAESRKPTQILGESARVKVTVPEGATMLRVTDTKGRTSTLSLSEVNKGDNPFHGVEVRKLEAGSIGKDKKFNVVKGEVAVEDLTKGPGTGAGPGSPAVGQGPDPKAQIEALEESFRGVAGKKISLLDQIKQASNIGQRAAQAKDVLSTAISGLKATGDYLIKKWEGVKNWDDMLRAKGELSAEIEKRGWRVRQFIKTVEKAMPDKKQRAAIAKWVDAGGDMAELQRGAAETKPEFRQAYLDAMNLKGDELIAAQNIRNYFESRLDEAIDAGVLEHGVEDYLHRIYERDPTAAKKMIAYVQAGVIKPNPALAKKRVFQADWEAEKLGYKPVQDFLPRVADYEASLTKAIASRAFIRKTLDMTAADGRPIVDIKGVGIPIEDASGVREATLIKPKSNPVKSNDPADIANYRGDYVNREYPSLSKWKWAGTDAAGKPIFLQGDVAIHPQYVGRIDALLEPSRIRYAKKPLARTVARTAIGISSTVKQTMLDFSGFHQVQITVHGLEHRVLPWKIVQDIDFQNPNVDGLLRGGVTLGGEYYHGNLSEGLVGRSLSRMIPGLGPLMQSYHEWLFQSYIPRIKMTMALHALERNRSRYAGKMSEEQIFAKTAAEANSAFGELNYITLERSQTARDISRIILLAPDFLEARGRFAGGALEKGGKAFGQEQRTALLLGALTMYITARLINKATDDQYHFEPENAFSIVHGNKAYGLRTVQGDILHLLERPYQFWLSRLNPVFGRTLLEAATQRDYFGRKRTLPQQAWDAVSTMMPIALRTGRERALWESLLNGFGVTARRWNDVDDAFKLAQEWKKKNLPRSKWEKGEFIYDPDKDALRGLKVALSNGDDGGSVKEIKKLIESKTITHQELNRYFDRYAAMPFTGSQANDRKFLAGLTEDQRKTVMAAREHKKQIRRLYRNAYGQYSDAVNQAAPQ